MISLEPGVGRAFECECRERTGLDCCTQRGDVRGLQARRRWMIPLCVEGKGGDSGIGVHLINKSNKGNKGKDEKGKGKGRWSVFENG